MSRWDNTESLVDPPILSYVTMIFGITCDLAVASLILTRIITVGSTSWASYLIPLELPQLFVSNWEALPTKKSLSDFAGTSPAYLLISANAIAASTN